MSDTKQGLRKKRGIRLPESVGHRCGDGRLEGDLSDFGNAELRFGGEVQSN